MDRCCAGVSGLTKMNYLSFEEELQREPIQIARAALSFSREIAYPGLEIDSYLQRLDHLADLASEAVPTHEPLARQALILSDFLFNQMRFEGNVTEYSDPRNSYLNEVLDRRLGIPISLSVVYIDVAQRLEIPAQGVGMPGHFIVGVSDPGGDLYLDPFHGGRHLSQVDCLRLVEKSTGYQGEFQLTWLEPVGPRRILTRMLFNLRNIYLQQQDWTRALAVVERLAMVQPDAPGNLRDLGVIYYQSGSLSNAVYYYEQYLLRAPEAEDADLVRMSLQSAAQQLAQRN